MRENNWLKKDSTRIRRLNKKEEVDGKLEGCIDGTVDIK